MRAQRRDGDGRVTFLVDRVDPGLEGALPDLFWERAGSGWCKTFLDTDPDQADRAFANLPALLERALLVAAGRVTNDWAAALAEVCSRFAAHEVDWWLCGSAALAVRGAPLVPGDVDLVVAEADAVRAGDVLVDVLMEPVTRATWGISTWFGRAVLGSRVEWAGGVTAAADRDGPSAFGPAAITAAEPLRWRGHRLRVTPLALQRVAEERRGRLDRVAMIDALA